MRTIYILIIILFCIAGMAQTQSEMNDAAAKSYDRSDKKLNNVYQKVLTQYSSDTIFIKNLKISQRLWVKFRDAEVKMKYPDRADNYYGSSLPMCYSNYLEQLTNERIKTLKEWIEGIKEGDVCRGTVKIKE